MSVSLREHGELLQFGPASATGAILRSRWLPFLPLPALAPGTVLPVRLLGESLVCFRDEHDGIGLIDEFCGHQMVSLKWGYTDDRGLRCAYHDWCYDAHGHCVDAPISYEADLAEGDIGGYPVRVHAGLLFTRLAGAEAGSQLELRDEPDDVPDLVTYSVIGDHWLQATADELGRGIRDGLVILRPPGVAIVDDSGVQALIDLVPMDMSNTLRVERHYWEGQPPDGAPVARYVPGDEAATDYWSAVDLAGARGRAFPDEVAACGCADDPGSVALHEWLARSLAGER